MFLSADKKSDYQHFLYGIVLYWLFETMVAQFTQCFFVLEYVLNPLAVYAGNKLLFLIAFYLFFRKPLLLNIKWIHIVCALVVTAFLSLLGFFVMDRLCTGAVNYEGHLMDCNLTLRDMEKVRLAISIATTLFIIVFLWWKFDRSESDMQDTTNRYFYGGALFMLTFFAVTNIVSGTANVCWRYTQHYLLISLIAYPLLAIVTAGAIYLLVRKKMLVLPIVAIMIVLTISFFSVSFLPAVLFHFLAKNGTYTYTSLPSEHLAYFSSGKSLCDLAMFLTSFILYRRCVRFEEE